MIDEIFSNLNDFITTAIDATYRPIGITILYTPWEGTNLHKNNDNGFNVEKQSVARPKCQKEQELRINRLEKVARVWIKQIREALGIAPMMARELHDITSEFDFWQSRCAYKQIYPMSTDN